MTETLLKQLEEKVINLLSEMELLRSELKQLRHENQALRNERTASTDKLKVLIQQLDSLVDHSSYSNRVTQEAYFEKDTVLA